MMQRSFRNRQGSRRLLPLSLLLATIVVLSTGCGLLSDDDPGDQFTTDVRVVDAVMGTEISPEQQIVGQVTRAFPVDTSSLYAILVLQNVEIGDEVTGRWYQLSVQDAPPDGAFVTEARIALGDEHLSAERAARVSLNLASDQGPLPPGDWVVRIHVNGVFVRTLGLVITDQVGATQPPPGPDTTATPEANPGAEEATPTPEAPETYTVQSGDTLIGIAEQFKPADETTDEYIARLLELNDLPADAIIFPDQELLLPGAP